MPLATRIHPWVWRRWIQSSAEAVQAHAPVSCVSHPAVRLHPGRPE